MDFYMIESRGGDNVDDNEEYKMYSFFRSARSHKLYLLYINLSTMLTAISYLRMD